MALKHYRPKHDTILAGEQEVAIFGLTVSDISILMDAHRVAIGEMYDLFSNTAKEGGIDKRIDHVIVESVRRVPDLVAGVIALAAREPDAVEQAKSLPFTTQVDALVKVFTLTFDEVGGLGNFSAVLQRALQGIAASPRQAPNDGQSSLPGMQ